MAGLEAEPVDPSDDTVSPPADGRGGVGDAESGDAQSQDSSAANWRALFGDLVAVDGAVTQAVTAETGLLGVQADMVLRLCRHPERRSPMNALAADMRVSGSSLTKLVDRLTELDLVRRDASVSDRRVVFVVLTEAGVREGARVRSAYVKALRQQVLAVIGSDVVGLAELARRLA